MIHTLSYMSEFLYACNQGERMIQNTHTILILLVFVILQNIDTQKYPYKKCRVISIPFSSTTICSDTVMFALIWLDVTANVTMPIRCLQ